MKKSKFSDTQIVSILKETESGMPVKEVCRQLNRPGFTGDSIS